MGFLIIIGLVLLLFVAFNAFGEERSRITRAYQKQLSAMVKAYKELLQTQDVQRFRQLAATLEEGTPSLERFEHDPLLAKDRDKDLLSSSQCHSLINFRAAYLAEQLIVSYLEKQEFFSGKEERKRELGNINRELQELRQLLQSQGDWYEEALLVSDYMLRQTVKLSFDCDLAQKLKESSEAFFKGEKAKARERYLEALHLVVTSEYAPATWDVAHWKEAFDGSRELYDSLNQEVDSLLDTALGLDELEGKLRSIKEKYS